MRMFFLYAALAFAAYVNNISGGRVFAPEQPVSPNVTSVNPTEIKVTWCRVNSNKVEIDHYELFIDNELEYSGIDVIYTAKRLKQFTWYEVKLRACGIFPNRCSTFSRSRVIRTQPAHENKTESSPNTALVTAVVVPSFMIGVIVGILVISLLIIWRYFCTSIWLSEPVTGLPRYIQQSLLTQHSSFYLTEHMTTDNKDGREILDSKDNSKGSLKCSSFCSNAVDTDNGLYNQLCFGDSAETVLRNEQPSTSQLTSNLSVSSCKKADDLCTLSPSISSFPELMTLQLGRKSPALSHSTKHYAETLNLLQCTQDEKSKDVQASSSLDHQYGDIRATAKGCRVEIGQPPTQELNNKQLTNPLNNLNISENAEYMYDKVQVNESSECDKNHLQLQGKDDGLNLTYHSSENNNNYSTTELSTKPDSILVVVDNSNIYIGAQECASSVNVSDRKRNVRVKLQHLVKILERGRSKDRAFACGSSPPASEPVWEVYRRLGYTVDLEDRRGKDEQRVDEGLHLCIYKALCELPPSVLVLATGDGTRGKSEFATSFPGCATKALQKGWQVELHSWKHSLSTEWNKLAKKYPGQLTINYLDQYVNHITFVDGRNGRKCLPIPSEYLARH